MKLAISNVCSAFGPNAVGTRVTDAGRLLEIVEAAVAAHDPTGDRVPGQMYLPLPEEAVATVSAGVGPASADPEHYVLRAHRGVVAPYLRRERAAQAESVAAVVYTAAAYNADPDVVREGGQVGEEVSHVIVAVLASAGPKSPLTPHRLVENLAGGNREALAWSGDEIRGKAREISEYYGTWSVVAD